MYKYMIIFGKIHLDWTILSLPGLNVNEYGLPICQPGKTLQEEILKGSM